MKKNLTLKLDSEVIDRAKAYARENEISLSKLIENYLSLLTNRDKIEREITPRVKSLSGVIKLPEDFDYKEARYQYLKDKHA